MPLYVVTDIPHSATRLVDAPNPAQALRHVTSRQFAVKVATAALVAKLMGTGIKVEPTTAEPEPQTQPQPATQEEGY